LTVHLYLAPQLHHPHLPWDTPYYRLLLETRAENQHIQREGGSHRPADYLDHPHHHPHRHPQDDHHLQDRPHLPQDHLQHPHHHSQHQVQQNVTGRPVLQQELKDGEEVVIPLEESVNVTVTVTLANGAELTLSFLVS
ncbi:E4 protein, partial [Lagenorhynchus acutus papillomavirus]